MSIKEFKLKRGEARNTMPSKAQSLKIGPSGLKHLSAPLHTFLHPNILLLTTNLVCSSDDRSTPAVKPYPSHAPKLQVFLHRCLILLFLCSPFPFFVPSLLLSWLQPLSNLTDHKCPKTPLLLPDL